jgi:hypothetical protein
MEMKKVSLDSSDGIFILTIGSDATPRPPNRDYDASPVSYLNRHETFKIMQSITLHRIRESMDSSVPSPFIYKRYNLHVRKIFTIVYNILFIYSSI